MVSIIGMIAVFTSPAHELPSERIRSAVQIGREPKPLDAAAVPQGRACPPLYELGHTPLDLLRLLTSEVGPKATGYDVRDAVAVGGKADVPRRLFEISQIRRRLILLSGH